MATEVLGFGGISKKTKLNYVNIRTRSTGGSDASCWIFTKTFSNDNEIMTNVTAYKVYREAVYENEYIKLDYTTQWYLYAKIDLYLFFNGNISENTVTKYSAGELIATWLHTSSLNYYMFGMDFI